MVDVGYVIAGINLVVGIGILIMTLIAERKLRGSVLRWAALLFMARGILFVAHAFIEVAGMGEHLYPMTALVATLLLGFSVMIIDVTTKMLGVKT